MSDGMDREKNERLTARELEEEEMKRELTGIGIYEPNLTYKQMKKLLEFVNESQDTSNVASNNKNMQEGTQHSDNECLSDITSDINMQQEVTLQECTEMPSYSYKLNHTSPTKHERKTIHYINSPESPPLFEARNPVYRRKSSDSDELFEKQHDSANSTHSTNRYLSLRSGNVSRECQSAAERRTAQNAQGEVVQKLERWRLNPLNVNINENDVPLRQPNRSSARERIPFEHCKEAHMSDQCDQVIRSVSQHLKEMADLWYHWRPINSIFQWGSPIQVGAANGSLDKKSLTDPKTEQTECTYRDGNERASKRKANTLIANLNRDSSTEDEDGNRYDFVRVKKKRAQSNDKSSNVACAANQHAHANPKKAMSNVIATSSLSNDNINTDIDNERVKYLSKRKTDEKNERVSPELTTYPRRITPPNPKTRLSLTRQRQGNAISKSSPKTRRTNENKVVEQVKDQKKDNTLTKEEIRRKLEEDWNYEEEDVTVEKNVEIRPLPISREMRFKIREKRLSLSKTAKDTQAAAKEEESDEERNKKKRLKLCEQRNEEELCRIKNRNGSWEHQLLSDDEDESSEMNQEFDAQNSNQFDNESTSTKNVSCPICNKWFPHNEIEDHAADCEQFETNNEEDSNDMDQLECNICSNYKTNNGMKYEEHVQQCINNRNDQRHLHGSEDIDTTSTSSFRNFIPIGEQKDSEIDYLGQFPSNSKKIVPTGRKRKR